MVRNAPKFYEIAKQVVELTEGAVFVAHNVRFDYNFVREEFRRLGFTFTRQQLCTVRLARKAFPGYRSYSLGQLIQNMNLNAGSRHRAMGDTMATVDLFERILSKENTQADILHMVNLGVKESLLPKNFSIEKLHSLPEACGVYYFHDENGDVVYVGKSLNIKKRIAEHFSGKTEKAAKLQQQVDDISWEITGSELVALLLESQEIKQIHPSINRAQKQRSYPYVIHSFENEDGYLCFEVLKTSLKARKTLNIVAEYPKVTHAKGWLTALQQKYQLCLRHCHLETKNGACFDFHLRRCKGACVGQELPDTYNERAREALEMLDQRFPEPNFFLIDQGRTDTEQAVVLVEEGEYRGYGFGELGEMNGNLDELRDLIKPGQSNPEVRRILQRFLSESNGLKMIKF